MAAIRHWHDEDNFVVDIGFDGKGVVYAFPIKELAEGASLSRMMNLKVKDTLNIYSGMVSSAALKQAAKEAVALLRPDIEAYFEARGA